MQRQRILVLVIDIDDDVSKTGMTTPIIGRENVFGAATSLALITPEDTDVNAIFGAVKQFDKLRKEGYENAEIALVSGSVNGGIEADMKIHEEVTKLISDLGCTSVVFVSDGGDDERIIPIIQSVVPIISVSRVVVQYSKNIEETYRVLALYIRKGLTEPRWVKYTLGIPGIIIVAVSVLAIFGFARYVALFAASILGLAMIARGFSVPELIKRSWDKEPILFVGTVISVFIVVAAIVTDFAISQSYLGNYQAAASLMVKDTFDYYIVAMTVYFSAAIVNSYLNESYRFWRDVTAITLVLSIRPSLFYLINEVVNNAGSIVTVENFLIKAFSSLAVTAGVGILAFRFERWVKERSHHVPLMEKQKEGDDKGIES
jgi:putative membrane protein